MMTKIRESADFIKTKLSNYNPKLAIILGSGLGVFADELENSIEIPYSEIPGFHGTTVVGHKGRFVIGELKGVQIVAMQGRNHFYEGHGIHDVVFPVRVLSQIGITTIIITNAAGGLNENYIPGDLACITDHINLTGQNPLIGENLEELGARFPDMSEAYSRRLNQILLSCAKKVGFELKSGVYAGFTGPSYETPHEIKMVKVIGGDLVGMSTVAEVIAANHAGLEVCGISCVTNLAAGISKEKLNHDEVKEVANMAMDRFTNLLKFAVAEIGTLKK